MLPAFLAMLLARTPHRGGWQDGFVAGLWMMLGFVLLFGVAGMLASILGQALFRLAPAMSLVVAVGFLWLSWRLWTGKTLAFHWGSPVERLQRRVLQGGRGTFFLYGISYAMVSLTCSLPVFLAVAATGFHESLLTGVARYLVYAAGMGLIVTGLAVAATAARHVAERLVKAVMPLMHKLSALVMALGSLYLLWYWFWGPGLHTGLL